MFNGHRNYHNNSQLSHNEEVTHYYYIEFLYWRYQIML